MNAEIKLYFSEEDEAWSASVNVPGAFSATYNYTSDLRDLMRWIADDLIEGEKREMTS